MSRRRPTGLSGAAPTGTACPPTPACSRPGPRKVRCCCGKPRAPAAATPVSPSRPAGYTRWATAPPPPATRTNTSSASRKPPASNSGKPSSARPGTPASRTGKVRAPRRPWTANWQSSRSTPTVDGELVYILTPHGNLVCLETATGKERWRKDFKKDFSGRKGDGWGYSESVLIDGDKVVGTPGGEKATMVALNK